MSDQKENYWAKFWSEYDFDANSTDEQSQVFRTRDRAPIEKDAWEHTVKLVANHMQFKPNDTLLDICCGNGLFIQAFCGLVESISAVDISDRLINSLKSKNIANVDAFSDDVRNISFPESSFSKVLWYAGIQYLPESDIVNFLKQLRSWIKPNGVVLIGDIPDRQKLWDYFNTRDRLDAYFDGIGSNKPIIGTWLDADWVEGLCLHAGFKKVEIIQQDPKLIYSDFRYDVLAWT